MSTETSVLPSAAEPLLGRTALVTGASRGIGAAIARALDTAGARVALTARSASRLAEVAGELRHDPVVLPADLTDADALDRLAADAVSQLGGRVDVLVNNAGAASGFGPAADLTTADVDLLLALNVRAPLLLAARIAPTMIEHGSGSIINISSVIGDLGTVGSSLYGATKGALDSLTRQLAAEWGPAGVRVNAVKPGATAETELIPGVDLHDPAFAGYYSPQVALRRVGVPTDIAGIVTFLASDEAGYITAQTITVDGGWTRTATPFPPAG